MESHLTCVFCWAQDHCPELQRINGQRFHLTGETRRTWCYVEGWMILTARIKKALYLPADVQLERRSRALQIERKRQFGMGSIQFCCMSLADPSQLHEDESKGGQNLPLNRGQRHPSADWKIYWGSWYRPRVQTTDIVERLPRLVNSIPAALCYQFKG